VAAESVVALESVAHCEDELDRVASTLDSWYGLRERRLSCCLVGKRLWTVDSLELRCDGRFVDFVVADLQTCVLESRGQRFLENEDL
jgi:hypothetical protein